MSILFDGRYYTLQIILMRYRMSMNEISKKSGLSYKDAGVNIDAGNQFVNNIKSLTKGTHRSEVLANIGGFGGLFSLANKPYKKPILVSSTDGVGTKLKLAQQLNKHDTIGIDLVAMCVNDIIVSGAEPLFFLDYFATGQLDPEFATTIVAGIAEGCKQAGAALIGGETAEMPGIYHNQDYDLAGFTVGIVDEEKLIDGSSITTGDVLLALPSSGPHSNGYSLIRKIIDVSRSDLISSFQGSTLGEILLTPTKIYVKTILELLKEHNIKAMAHITGGGLIENVPRVLPQYTQANIFRNSWHFPEIFEWLQKTGGIELNEMFRTFNCGIGMVLVIAEDELSAIESKLKILSEPYFIIGQISKSSVPEPSVVLN